MTGSVWCDLDAILMTEIWPEDTPITFNHMEEHRQTCVETRTHTHTANLKMHTDINAYIHTVTSKGRKSITIGSCHLQSRYFSSGLSEITSEKQE